MVRASKKNSKFFRKKNEAEKDPYLNNSHFYGSNDYDKDCNQFRVDWDWESEDGKYVRENCKTLDRYNQSRGDRMHNAMFGLFLGVDNEI